MIRWSEAEINAVVEYQAPEPTPEHVAAVKSGCICPNAHQPDMNGIIVTSPSCQEHGCQSRFVPMTRLTQQSARTVGVIHSRHSTS
jgi:hypothetical protein